MTTGQCRFVSWDKWATLVGDVGSEGSYAGVEAGGIWEISVPSSSSCCEPTTALKKMKSLQKLINLNKGGRHSEAWHGGNENN